ncbi:tetratricopeptide repeat protein [Oceanibacterium hippocampi]|uniref:Tetratricopeptide repeat protein n=1 Tax=Oceanibacterium hippocampi TaxID=745714 RepID=A0A1Y5TB23_9PROT|nr:tetratricopeptide repeat protein [Oceanibacterium hippocampi]SLN59776.1 tetratricopeptide repeat protein [Oceanibacterium hippocampi]
MRTTGSARARTKAGVDAAGEGRALHKAGRLKEAARAYEKALKADPRDDTTRSLLGAARLGLGQAGAAVDCFRMLVRRAGDDPRNHFNLAIALTAAGRTEEAEASIRACLERAPDDPAALNNLGDLLRRRGALEEAERHFRKALAHAPGMVEAMVNLAALLANRYQTEHRDEAEALLRRAIAARPGLARAHEILAQVIGAPGRRAEALAAAREAAALAPRALSAQVGLARAAILAGDYEAAEAAASRAIEADPDSAEAHYLAGAAAYKLNRVEAARAAFETSLARDPENRSPSHAECVAALFVTLQALSHGELAAPLMDYRRLVRPALLPLPEGFADHAELNRKLAAEIRAHPTLRFDPEGRVAHGAALTDNLLADPSPAHAAFIGAVRRAIEDYRTALPIEPSHPILRARPKAYHMVSWATLTRAGGLIDSHIHEHSWLSGAYYATLPDMNGTSPENPEGWIEFGRPTPFFTAGFEPLVHLVRPEPGLLVLFPSALFHRTVPFTDEAERISLSFNCYPD